MTRRASKTVPRHQYDTAQRERIALLQVLTDLANGVPPAGTAECLTDGYAETLTLYRATGPAGGLVLISQRTPTHAWIDVQPLDCLAALHHAERRHSERLSGRDAAIAGLLHARDRAFAEQRRAS